MSKTIRRKSGNRWFDENASYRKETSNNPYWLCSPIRKKWIRGEFVEKSKWTFNYRAKKYEYKLVQEEVGGYWVEWYEERPRDLAEVALRDEETRRKFTTDGCGHFWKKPLKEHAKEVRRSDNRKELSRIKKLSNYEDMQYVDSLRNSNPWIFD